ncbi:glycosyl transferase family 39 [Gloeothece citriformis PCC 7424]|uniref:Glycosyl transferase family 39 n=1 Tax=Gloeothece citriformis (strain PCC 7424) TaxID=65393 RepID=B7KL96_GLOC7|nr:glycosyltransferase family 39 protein [Gloeothece citriformis]ACK72468.1 glycosyl transferase family 39 [Gloeothece citriformis PCC 7424]
MTKTQLDPPLKNRHRFLAQHSKKLWIFSIFWLALISWIGFLWNLGSIGLVDKTEPMFVEAARQMVVTGDWITPYWNGETRFDKPPLSYWLMAIAFKVFGVNEWAARIPSALMAIALVVLGFYTLRFFGFLLPTSKKDEFKLWLSAWLGAGILALNPAWIAWARTGVSDMYLSSSIAMALLSFFIGYAQQEKDPELKDKFSARGGWYILFYVFMALAVLAKGPIGIVLPVFIVSGFLFYVGKFKQVLLETKPLRGSLIFLAIAVPWFVLVTLANGKEYIDVFFGHHNFQRFTSVVSYHPGPWYYFIPVVLVGLIPWSIYLPSAMIQLKFWDRNLWKTSDRSTHLGLFSLFWFSIIFIFFSASSTKLPSYVLPGMPAAGILVTLFWSAQFDKNNKLSKQRWLLGISGLVNIVVLIALALASFYSPQLVGGDPRKPEFSTLLQQSSLPILGGLIWGLVALGAIFLLLRRRDWRWLWIPNLIGFMAFISFIALPVAQIRDKDSQLPLRQLSALITQVRQPGEELLLVGFIRPSLVYYTRQNVEFFNNQERLIEYLESQKNSSQVAPTVLLITEQKYIDRLGLKPQDYQFLDQQGVYQVLRVTRATILAKK